MGVLVKAGVFTSLLFSSVLAIPTITAKGAKLFTSDGKQFFNKGQFHGNILQFEGTQCRLHMNGQGRLLAPNRA